MGLILGSGRSPGGGHGNPLHYSCLQNPMDRGAWWDTVHRVTKSRTRLSNFTFTFNIRAPQYVRQMLKSMKGEINNNTIVGDFNTPLTPMDRSTKQKINKETQTLNDTIDQLDLTDIYKTFHPQTTNFTFFSSAHGTFSRIDHILGHKSSLGKFKKLEIITRSFLTTMQ